MSSFRHVVIVVLENASRDTVLKNKYMSELRKKGVFLSNSYCVTHPSQPNYFTMVAGDTVGVTNDAEGWVYWAQNTASIGENEQGYPTYPEITSIVDLLEHKKLTWKAYAGGYKAGFGDASYPHGIPASNILAPSSSLNMNGPFNERSPLYYPVSYPSGEEYYFTRRHVPFLSFPNIVNNPERLKNIVDASDFKPKELPHYSFYTPDLIDDGHNSSNGGNPLDPFTDTEQLDNIQKFLTKFLGDDPVGTFAPETLIVITFDESYGANEHYSIYTLLIGDMLEAGTVCHEPYNHYSLLRTIEDNFHLGTLGRNDAAATPYWFVRSRCGN